MWTLLLAGLLVLWTSAASAQAINQGGTTGAGFTCDSATGKCTCQGPWESADCQLMDKNCSKTGPVFHSCEEHPPFNCYCSMFAKKPPEKIQPAPVAPSKSPN
jgi:hypothetical protein